jgi:uroporphyrinogen-III decarboxylase
MPLLDMFAEIGVDCLIGVDPARWDIKITKENLGGKVCLSGGVNGYNTIELGRPEQVRAEIQEAMRLFNPPEGYILSPVDNIREDTSVSQQNVAIMIDEWLKLRK